MYNFDELISITKPDAFLCDALSLQRDTFQRDAFKRYAFLRDAFHGDAF